MVEITKNFLAALRSLFKSRFELQAEILVLRHQLNVLRRRARSRPHLRNWDRLRVKGAFAGVDGAPLPIGGKTGTGDLRFERFGPGGRLIESRVVARTATFVFFIGDRFFGTVTAYVAGPRAAEYHFTSALAAQLFKALAPALQPLLGRNVDLAEGQPRLGSTMTMASEAGAAATAPPAASAPASAFPVIQGKYREFPQFRALLALVRCANRP